MPPLPPVATVSVSRARLALLAADRALATAARRAEAPRPPQASARRMASDRRRRAQLRVERVARRRSRSRARPARRGRASKPGCSAWAMILPISWKSSTWRPRVASADVPTRRPLETIGGRGSNGTALRLTVMPIVVQAVLGLLAVELGLAQVDEHEVHVGAAGEDVDAVAGAAAAPRRPPWRPRPCAPGAPGRRRTGAILSATALPAITCSSGPPCWPGKTAELIFLAYSSRAEDHAAARRRRASCGSSS